MSDLTLESALKEETTSVSVAPGEETNTEVSKLGEDELKKTETTGETETPDYKALLEQERKRRERAEDKVVKLKKLSKKVQATNADEDDVLEDEDTEPEEEKVSKLVAQQVAKIRDEVRGELVQSEVEDLLSELTSNADERELIRDLYENRLQKSGFSRASIREDLENAKLLANKQTLLRSNRELSEALKSKATVSTAPNFVSGTRETEKSGTQYSSKERALLEKFGVKT